MEVATGQPPPPVCELHRRLVVAVLVGLSLVGAEAAFVFMNKLGCHETRYLNN